MLTVSVAGEADNKDDFILPDATYFCPQCGKVTLRFQQVGFVD
jgi:hypothetical protein